MQDFLYLMNLKSQLFIINRTGVLRLHSRKYLRHTNKSWFNW